mmetsp:Transcript_15064/g.34740  ORF Transcript_15064/g.34740 Transcript_15064/m.34740 type:complete len:210 (+) Transcript_15064:114-743(+)
MHCLVYLYKVAIDSSKGVHTAQCVRGWMANHGLVVESCDRLLVAQPGSRSCLTLDQASGHGPLLEVPAQSRLDHRSPPCSRSTEDDAGGGAKHIHRGSNAFLSSLVNRKNHLALARLHHLVTVGVDRPHMPVLPRSEQHKVHYRDPLVVLCHTLEHLSLIRSSHLSRLPLPHLMNVGVGNAALVDEGIHGTLVALVFANSLVGKEDVNL